MSTEDPVTPFSHTLNYPVATYLWVLWLSVFASSVAYLERIKAKGPSGFSFWVLSIELFTASFIGLMTFMVCELQRFDGRYTAIAIGAAAHMSTRAIFVLRRKILGEDFAHSQTQEEKDAGSDNQ